MKIFVPSENTYFKFHENYLTACRKNLYRKPNTHSIAVVKLHTMTTFRNFIVELGLHNASDEHYFDDHIVLPLTEEDYNYLILMGEKSLYSDGIVIITKNLYESYKNINLTLSFIKQ